ncbi:hypothetical protein H5410_056971 [Solanum commersonii]|uniref:PUB 62/63 C-terminal domain-containing protein n=1 Tax=Solanum commersonii TaxID=4109 RepID=A0A9J5WNB4_SOLCO|nr:hypothetical protein H5410_056971 [Solanum commersonii]
MRMTKDFSTMQPLEKKRETLEKMVSFLPKMDPPHKGVQYPFSVNEKVLIRGNRRTPEKIVGKEAVITSQCLNGWIAKMIFSISTDICLRLWTVETGENIRLQYHSLRKFLPTQETEERCQSQTVQNSS